MKLEQIAGLAVTIGSMLALSGCACGSHAAAQTTVPKPQVATTQLMAAELTEADNAPHVGKSQHSMASKDAFEASDDKDAPRRDERRHNGGGFSGWK